MLGGYSPITICHSLGQNGAGVGSGRGGSTDRGSGVGVAATPMTNVSPGLVIPALVCAQASTYSSDCTYASRVSRASFSCTAATIIGCSVFNSSLRIRFVRHALANADPKRMIRTATAPQTTHNVCRDSRSCFPFPDISPPFKLTQIQKTEQAPNEFSIALSGHTTTTFASGRV